MATLTTYGTIQGLNVVYNVDTKKKMVIGTIDSAGWKLDAIDKMERQLMSEALDSNAKELLRIEIPISAVAKCSPEDTFDIDEGIHIVNIRLNDKIDKARESTFLRYYDYISKHLLAAEKCLKKYAVTNKPAKAIANLHSTIVHGYGENYK